MKTNNPYEDPYELVLQTRISPDVKFGDNVFIGHNTVLREGVHIGI